MKKIATALLLSGAALGAAPALAQDVNPVFTGPRVEALVGYDNLGAGSDVDNDSATDDDQSIDGVTYGIGIGYDFAFSGAVFGVEGEYTDSSGKVDFNNEDDPTGSNAFGFGRVGAGRDLYVGARAGVLVTPATLAYVKAGYTNARLDVLARDGTTELTGDYNLDGYRIGAGVERALGTNAFAKLEYRYSNYGNADYEVDGNPTGIEDLDIDADRHQILFGIGYRF